MISGIIWAGPVFDRGGYGNVSRNYVVGLYRLGIPIRVINIGDVHREIDLSAANLLSELANADAGSEPVVIIHGQPGQFTLADELHIPGIQRRIGCTIFETDRVPQTWVDDCNRMDEIWVPSHFNYETFAASGVQREKLRVIPYGVDTKLFDRTRAGCESFRFESWVHRFRFLYTFALEYRKGLDLLLEAYCQEFTREEAVALVLKGYVPSWFTASDTEGPPNLKTELQRSIVGKVDVFRRDLPQVVVLDTLVSSEQLIGLYLASDAYISTDRANGWGMPCLEMMSLGKPAATINWSGSTEFMNDQNSFLIQPTGRLVSVDSRLQRTRPEYQGHQWAEVTTQEVRRVLRSIYENKNKREQVAARGHEDARTKYSMESVARQIIETLQCGHLVQQAARTPAPSLSERQAASEPAQDNSAERARSEPQAANSKKRHGNGHHKSIPKAIKPLKAGVFFSGPVYGGSGYAEEAWVQVVGLAEHQVPVQLQPQGPQEDSKNLLPREARRSLERLTRQQVDLTRSVFYQCNPGHAFNLSFYGLCRVGRTMFETDRIPDGWLERCQAMDEVWVPSQFNFRTFAAAGVDERRLKVMPAGVDTRLFKPGAKPLQIPKTRGFNFLSVFDWNQRKGFDVLLKAYLNEFKPDEDVALILKIYQYSDPFANVEAQLSYFVEREVGLALDQSPPIILVNGFIPQSDMPRLYGAAQAFVLPSRGEGYGRPFMESLACQVPVIATRWSGQLDFLNGDNSYLIDTEGIVPVPPDVDMEYYAGHQWAEPSVDHLRQLMRQVFSHPEEARLRAERGRADMLGAYDWNLIIPRWVAEFQRLLS